MNSVNEICIEQLVCIAQHGKGERTLSTYSVPVLNSAWYRDQEFDRIGVCLDKRSYEVSHLIFKFCTLQPWLCIRIIWKIFKIYFHHIFPYLTLLKIGPRHVDMAET